MEIINVSSYAEADTLAMKKIEELRRNVNLDSDDRPMYGMTTEKDFERNMIVSVDVVAFSKKERKVLYRYVCEQAIREI